MLHINEKDFSSEVEDLLNIFGWTWCHFRPAMVKRGREITYRTALSGKKGFPDYFAVRIPRVLIIELKSDDGALSQDQREWAELLLACPGVEYYLLRPSDIDMIASLLSQQPAVAGKRS